MSELDNRYRAERLRLSARAEAAAAFAWARTYGNREAAMASVIPIVQGAQGAQVVLLDAYFAAKGRREPKGLPRDQYTTAAIRGLPAEEVYARPFGAYGSGLNDGLEQEAALARGSASVVRLVATDVQLAQTHAARDWLEDEPEVYGYRRVLGGGHSCSLCRSASTRIYYRESLMPIHERCHCSVEPLWGTHPGGLSVPADAVRVAPDPELGARMLEESWAA